MPAISNETASDLREAVAYLNGISVILEQLHAEERGRDGQDDALIAKLQALDQGVSEWAPLRYQNGPGSGWHFVSENVLSLTRRLEKALEQLNS